MYIILFIITIVVVVVIRFVSLPVDPGSSSLRFPLGVRGDTR